jgi:hypothetical protein
LPVAQALSASQTGYLKSTTGTGVVATVPTIPTTDLPTNVALTDRSNHFTAATDVDFGLTIHNPNAPANQRLWAITNTGSVILQPMNDAGASVGPSATFDRSANLYLSTSGAYFEQGRSTPVGFWIDVPGAAGNFHMGSYNGGNWNAGTISTFAYTLIGQTLTLSFYISAGNWYATTNRLYVLLPANLTAQRYTHAIARAWSDVMPAEPVSIFPNAGTQWLEINRMNGANFAASAGVCMQTTITVSI